MIVLGIETSCDETAAAIVEDGNKVLSSVVASQVKLHHAYGGVVPELASRKHMEVIDHVVEEAMHEAGVHGRNLDAIAVTRGPGLIGALLVGFNFAKGMAYAMGVPCVGINHLEAHLNAIFLEADPPPFPFVGLLVSGGHTGIYHVTSHTDMALLGQTRDDAAGEAFDKVAKMLNLGYPGGVILSEMSRQGDPAKIRFPRPFLDKEGFDFSFSGLKTAVRRHIETHPDTYKSQLSDIAAGFQEAVTDVLCHKIITAAKQRHCSHLVLAGGVAANQRLRERVREEAQKSGFKACLPSPVYCGDNAAMIAASGYHHLMAGESLGFMDDVYSRVRYGS
ncbi:MAG: tRNA (adenosine(37)-N6)-threonylcarbamoyltransferase complex transferase subunit TsaD [Desulfobacteraceae bacterium]|nr:tRNA (adenosine(37)-N6)-threonylcarbamoyltransferase complex transferase subunit TsaD [Desulfobacteraceae bacterium]MBU4002157.1 tRNA (adenosine(37)-N6)-threonylcarbamoyltransferase complex transferase subunit TsaD [Pseudomonadota bacterium]MBU4053294.1 tRNA (adenosine(37)-N6)-threonylcarbamoyltransferase complex transferase subunit TsaD [Pseudomonadota bacterium]